MQKILGPNLILAWLGLEFVLLTVMCDSYSAHIIITFCIISVLYYYGFASVASLIMLAE